MLEWVFRWAIASLLCASMSCLAETAQLRMTHLAEPPAAMTDQGAPPVAPDMQRVRDARLAFQRRGTDWYMLQLDSDWHDANPPLLTIRGILTGRLVVYAPPAYEPQLKSIYAAALDNAYSRRMMVYPLPADLHANQPIYIALGRPGQPTPVQANIVDAGSYHAADLNFVRINTFYISLQVAMLLVIACFWLVLRDRIYLNFIAYQLLLVVYAMSQSGELYSLPGGALFAAGNLVFTNFLAALIPAFAIRFLLAFARLRSHTPRLARLLSWLSVAFFILAACMWLPVRMLWWNWVFYSHNALLIIGSVIALTATWMAWHRGNRQAGYFLLSWLPLLVLLVARAWQQIAYWMQPTWLEYGFAATMAFASLIIAAGLADRTEQVRRERDQATHLAQFDPLTGELNRRAILAHLHEAWGSGSNEADPMAVLFLDIDHFKQINDHYGHAAGDECLGAVTVAVRAEIGREDRVGRIGGEEFVVLLRGDRARNAKQVAERIGERIAATRVHTHGYSIRQTVSIGVAQRRASTASVEELVGNADEAQYRAKAAGRNCVIEYQGGGDRPARSRPAATA